MTLRLTDAEFDLALKPDVKPTSRTQGHWRSVAWMGAYSQSRCANMHECIALGEDIFAAPRKCPSAELAEQIGIQTERELRADGIADHRFLRAQFFPDYPSGGA